MTNIVQKEYNLNIKEAYEKALNEFSKEYGISWRGNRIRCYLDVVIHHPDWTIEDFEKEEERLKEESDKLTDWSEIK